MLDEWSKGWELPSSINASGNTNYPYVLTDGVTIYYASDGESSIGGYDIFVTRYNTATDTYMRPENVGMPFNSPYNDYMYVIDEYNNLGWFASDRYQPEGKVCIYVFIPNESKQVYNYEAMDPKQIVALAQLHSLKTTWKDQKEVDSARKRLEDAINHKPQEQFVADFEFVIDDHATYYHLDDFKSPQAKDLFKRYQTKEKDYRQQENKLDNQRQWYARANKEEKAKIAPSILDLEKRVRQMSRELDEEAIIIRNTEIQYKNNKTMDVLIIIVLIIAAVILFLVELFVIPGISFAGIAALGCIIFANYYAFANLGTGAGFITLVVSGVACVGSLVGFMRSKTLDKLALKKDITSKIDNSAANKIKVGDMGITTTRLAQIGYAEIEGNIIEVKSTEGLLDEKTPIIVNRIADGTIFVEKQKP